MNAAVAHISGRGVEDDILRLESVVTGFGGMMVDSSGAVTIYLQDGSMRATAATALAAVADLFDDPRSRADIAAGRITVRRGDFSFSQLVDWQIRALGTLPVDGLQSVDADEALNRVRIGLLEGTSPLPFVKAFQEEGIPEAAVVFEFRRPVQFASLRSYFPNGIGGGVQVTNPDGPAIHVCSVGFNVLRAIQLDSGFLTASHCVNNDTPWLGQTAMSFYQEVGYPNYSTSKRVASVTLNPSWTLVDARCNSNPHCAYADVAYLKYYADKAYRFQRLVAATQYAGVNNTVGSINEVDWWANGPKSSAVIGAQVDKVGRTTGWTRGTHMSSCEAVTVVLHVSAPVRLICLDRVDNASVGDGDSGGPVLIPPTGSTGMKSLGILNVWGATPNDPVNGENLHFCNSNCSYWYSTFSAIQTHLGTSFFTIQQ